MMINWGFLIIFILIQILVNNVVGFFFAPVLSSIYGAMAYELLSSLIIAFIAALISTPAGFRRDFYRQPGFHKYMMLYFIVFIVFGAFNIMLRFA